jgi:hypothetical protein
VKRRPRCGRTARPEPAYVCYEHRRSLYECQVAAARSRPGEPACEETGRTMAPDQAVEYALDGEGRPR